MAYNLGSRIIQLRTRNGLSQEGLANELGLSRQAISRWERGEALPDTENLIALADLFGITLDELIRSETAAPRQPEPTPAVLSKAGAEEPETEGPSCAAEADGRVAGEGAPLDEVPEREPDAPSTSLASADEPRGEAFPPSASAGPDEGDTTPDETALASSSPLDAARDPDPAATLPATRKPLPIWLLILLGIVGALLALLVITALGCSLFMVRPSRVTGPSGSDAPTVTVDSPSDSVRQAEYDIEGDSVTELDVNWPFGSVCLEATDAYDTIHVTEEWVDRSGNRGVALSWELVDGELLLKTGRVTGVDEQQSLTVLIPSSVMARLDDVTIQQTSGDLDIRQISCGDLEVDLLSGTLSAEGVQAGSLDLELASGDSNVSGAFGTLDVELVSGVASILCTTNPTSAEIDVVSGRLELALPKDCGFTLTSEQGVRSIPDSQLHVDFPLVYQDAGATHGDGSTPIALSVLSGELTITQVR